MTKVLRFQPKPDPTAASPLHCLQTLFPAETNLRSRWAGWRASAARAVRTFFVRVHELLRDEVHGWITRSKSRLCRSCWTLHEGFHRCQHRLMGWCMACGRKRLLDRFARCSAGHDSVVRVTLVPRKRSAFDQSKGDPHMRKTTVIG